MSTIGSICAAGNSDKGRSSVHHHTTGMTTIGEAWPTEFQQPEHARSEAPLAALVQTHGRDI